MDYIITKIKVNFKRKISIIMNGYWGRFSLFIFNILFLRYILKIINPSLFFFRNFNRMKELKVTVFIARKFIQTILITYFVLISLYLIYNIISQKSTQSFPFRQGDHYLFSPPLSHTHLLALCHSLSITILSPSIKVQLHPSPRDSPLSPLIVVFIVFFLLTN